MADDDLCRCHPADDDSGHCGRPLLDRCARCGDEITGPAEHVRPWNNRHTPEPLREIEVAALNAYIDEARAVRVAAAQALAGAYTADNTAEHFEATRRFNMLEAERQRRVMVAMREDGANG